MNANVVLTPVADVSLLSSTLSTCSTSSPISSLSSTSTSPLFPNNNNNNNNFQFQNIDNDEIIEHIQRQMERSDSIHDQQKQEKSQNTSLKEPLDLAVADNELQQQLNPCDLLDDNVRCSTNLFLKPSTISQNQCSPTINQTEEFNDSENLKSDQELLQKPLISIPELIETLKNLAACNEKLYKWEQSRLKLQTIPETDPNKKQLMHIIDIVDNKESTREKAIYLYQELGRKCRLHGNYIGAAKAFERAAGLLMDVTDRADLERATEETVMETIRCLESAIHNYDAIHKYKHAGTLHYRCSRILKLMNADHKQVEQHHIKALEYFTKPDHELKQRKRIEGLKISCYSSCSTWAQMTQHSTTKTTSTSSKTTHHRKTITTNHHLIKFHHPSRVSSSPGGTITGDVSGESDAESEEILGDLDSDLDENNSNLRQKNNSSIKNKKTLFEFTSNIEELNSSPKSFGPQQSLDQSSYLDEYFEKLDGCRSASDSMIHSNSRATLAGGEDTNGTSIFNESMPTTPTTPSSLTSSIADHNPNQNTSSSISKQQQQQQKHQSSNSSPSPLSSNNNRFHKDNHNHLSTYHQHQERHGYHHRQSSTSYSSSSSSFYRHQKMYSSLSRDHTDHYHPPHPTSHHQKPIFRCIEDRIESAKKLVKKLQKLCPFYEVSTNGVDAGRVYCKICDRYLGAVSSTLKNHVNTQEHRQAFEDNGQQQLPFFNGQQTTIPIQITDSVSNNQNPSVPMITFPTNRTNEQSSSTNNNLQPQTLNTTILSSTSSTTNNNHDQQNNFNLAPQREIDNLQLVNLQQPSLPQQPSLNHPNSNIQLQTIPPNNNGTGANNSEIIKSSTTSTLIQSGLVPTTPANIQQHWPPQINDQLPIASSNHHPTYHQNQQLYRIQPPATDNGAGTTNMVQQYGTSLPTPMKPATITMAIGHHHYASQQHRSAQPPPPPPPQPSPVYPLHNPFHQHPTSFNGSGNPSTTPAAVAATNSPVLAYH